MANENDIAFEAQFGDLAYASLQGKSPALLDYLVGFQVLDKNDDETHAVGVFGAKVGKEWVYIPVFFSNGELKGMEILYLKNQDLFVPNEEDWVIYIINRRPMKLGESSGVTERDLLGGGIDTDPFEESPREHSKFAADWSAAIEHVIEKARGFDKSAAEFYCGYGRCPGWTHTRPQPWAADSMRMRPPQLDISGDNPTQALFKAAEAIARPSIPSLPDWLSQAGPRTTRTLVEAMQKRAGLAQTIARFHDPSDLLVTRFEGGQLEKAAGQYVHRYPDGSALRYHGRVKEAEEEFENDLREKGKVRIVTYQEAQSDLGGASGLTEEEKERLARGEVVIKDNRTEASQVFPAERPQTLSSITETGVYHYLAEDGRSVRALIIPRPVKVKHPNANDLEGPPHHNPGVSNPRLTLVRLDGPGTCEFDSEEIVATPEPESFPAFAGIPDGPKASEVETGKRYVLVTPSGTATQPFKVVGKRESEDGQTYIQFNTWIEEFEDDTGPSPGLMEDDGVITISPAVSRIDHIGRRLFVPETARAVEVKGEWKKYPRFGLPRPADPGLVIHGLWEKGFSVPLKLHGQGQEYHLTMGEEKSSCSRMELLSRLVREEGLRGADAQDLIKQADVEGTHNRAVKYVIVHAPGYGQTKQAAPFKPRTNGYGAPAVNPNDVSFNSDAGVPETNPNAVFETVQGSPPSGEVEGIYDPNPALDENINDKLQSAAQTGQQDVFDTAMVGSLVKAVNSDDLIDKYIGDLILGMDRIGRILFLFLNANEDFAERFGQEDLLELEDSLRNTFKSMGDLILFLKQKAIDDGASGKKIDQ